MKTRMTERVLFVDRRVIHNLPPFGLRYDMQPVNDGMFFYHPHTPQPCFARPGDKLELNIRCIASGAIEITVSIIGELEE
jgi:hypothetical protein